MIVTTRNSRRTITRVYRWGLLVSALWLLVSSYWSYVVVRALLETRSAPTMLERVAGFDRYAQTISYGALVACLLFVTRVVMFLQWPNARLLWRSWRR